jgi:ankyrin repeat protein
LILSFDLKSKASNYGREGVIKLLLEKNANVNKQNKNGQTALIWGNYDF